MKKFLKNRFFVFWILLSFCFATTSHLKAYGDSSYVSHKTIVLRENIEEKSKKALIIYIKCAVCGAVIMMGRSCVCEFGK